MKWDYLAITLRTVRGEADELRREVERWRREGWRLEDVWPGGFDEDGADPEDECVHRTYTCVFRRPTATSSEYFPTSASARGYGLPVRSGPAAV
jgi:hypothetical protein